MDYIELNCHLQPVDPWRDILIAQLAEAGFESFQETDNGFKAYIPADTFNEDSLNEALSVEVSDEKPLISFKIENIKGENWNSLWESNFEPVKVGSRLYIRAPFHKPDPGAQIEIVIEPKMSFGTGHHETTYLISEWLLDIDLENKTVLDMGCGTGILAILAAHRGADRVTAIDNHPFAYENSLENVSRNKVNGVKVLLGEADLLGNEKYDIIIANITKNVLMADMNVYSQVLNPGGLLLLSGFLLKDKDDLVARAKSLHIEYSGHRTKKDWMALLLKKKD